MSAAGRARGFTLIEVLIALVIAATALSLGMGALSGGARRLARIEETMLARWALDNVVSELTLRAAGLDPGRHSFTETLLGRTLAVHVDVAREEAPPILRLGLVVEDAARPGVVLERESLELLHGRP